MRVFHIVSIAEWNAVGEGGSYQPPSLTSEGFIHFSHSHQVAATANRYYGEVDELQVLEVDSELAGGPWREEPSPVTGELFPHLYGPLLPAAVIAVHPLRRDDAGAYIFPED